MVSGTICYHLNFQRTLNFIKFIFNSDRSRVLYHAKRSQSKNFHMEKQIQNAKSQFSQWKFPYFVVKIMWIISQNDKVVSLLFLFNSILFESRPNMLSIGPRFRENNSSSQRTNKRDHWRCYHICNKAVQPRERVSERCRQFHFMLHIKNTAVIILFISSLPTSSSSSSKQRASRARKVTV